MTDKIISRMNKTDAAKAKVKKTADYIRRTPSRISAKRMNASRLNKQKNLYRSTGIRGDLMTDKVISRMNKVDAAKRKARTVGGKIKEAPKNVVRKVNNAMTRRTNTKNVSRAMAENEFARRRMHLRNETGKDLAKGKLSDVAKLRLRRAADKVGGAYQKTKSKARNISKRIPTGVTVNVNGRSHTIRRKHVAGAAGLAGGAYGGYRYYKRRKNSRKRR